MFRRILFSLVIVTLTAIASVVFMTGCGQQSDKLKNDTRLWIEEAWNKGNLSVLDGLIAADFVYHNIPFADMNGLDAYKQFITANRTAYPDIKITLEDVIVEGDRVVARGTYQGTQQGLSPTMGISTGKPVNFKWCTVTRVENGKFIESWAYIDWLGLRQQVGYTMLPPVTDKTFARVTIGRVKPENVEEFIKIYRESVVPAIKSQKGFRGIYDLSDLQTGKGLSISIWDSEADAVANEQSGVYKAQLDKFKGILTAPPVREGYTVAVQE